MTKIILKNNKEYPIPIGGTNSTAKKLVLKVQTEEEYETVREIFNNPENTANIRSVNDSNETLMAYEGYTQLDNKGTVDEAYVVESPQYGEDGSVTKEAVTGRVITLTLYKQDTEETTEGDTSEFDAIWKEVRQNG
jgi:hypothetical protein